MPSKCRVWTASYGGAHAMIIKASTGDMVNYTVLDVNEKSSKREADAYHRIAAAIGTPESDILFLSDVEAELDAAKAAGMATAQLVRSDTQPESHGRHATAATFRDIVP